MNWKPGIKNSISIISFAGVDLATTDLIDLVEIFENVANQI